MKILTQPRIPVARGDRAPTTQIAYISAEPAISPGRPVNLDFDRLMERLRALREPSPEPASPRLGIEVAEGWTFEGDIFDAPFSDDDSLRLGRLRFMSNTQRRRIQIRERVSRLLRQFVPVSAERARGSVNEELGLSEPDVVIDQPQRLRLRLGLMGWVRNHLNRWSGPAVVNTSRINAHYQRL